MSGSSTTLRGYVKTSNMYLIVLIALIAGFLGGVVVTSYRTASMTDGSAAPGVPQASGTPPITKEQSQALTALLQATRATPDNANAWTELGHLYFDTEQYEKAIQAYEKSLELAPSRPNVWTDLGVMYRRAGDPKRAVECFDRALSIDANHQTALFNKGVVLMHDIKDAPAALQAWEKLVQINPDAQMPDGRSVKSMVEHFRNANPS